MTVGWQRIRLPMLERLALAELAKERGQSEEATLAQLVRAAVKVELTTAPAAAKTEATEADHDTAH